MNQVELNKKITKQEAKQVYEQSKGKLIDETNEAFVSLKNINKIYPNGVQAVYDFNLDINKQEFVALVGPSGCGKSTTLRMIAGLEEITSGYLYINKVLSNYLPSKDRDIAMVFQSYALYPQMTVYENILRDYDDISDELKKVVWAKAKELGYIPNNLATFMKKGKTNYIALIFNSLHNPYFSVMCEKMIKGFRELGYEAFIFFYNSQYLTLKELEIPILNRCCAVVSFIECSEEASKISYSRDFPILVLGMNSDFDNVSCIYTDDYSGGYQVGEYALNNHFKNLLYVGNNFTETSARRQKGFIDALNNKGVNCNEFLYKYDDPYEKQDEVVSKMIMENKYDFIFFYNDEVALNVKHLLIQKGYDINQTRLFGYDNLANYFSLCERLDSVSFDFDEISNFACESIVKLLKDKDLKRVKKVFPVKLSTY